MTNNEVKSPWAKRPNFKPEAYYSREKDFIYVLIRDCNARKVRINDFLDILEDCNPGVGEDKYVGFMIKSARQLCLRHRLRYRGDVDLAELLDKIMIISLCPVSYHDEIYRILTLAPTSLQISEKPVTIH